MEKNKIIGMFIIFMVLTSCYKGLTVNITNDLQDSFQGELIFSWSSWRQMSLNILPSTTFREEEIMNFEGSVILSWSIWRYHVYEYLSGYTESAFGENIHTTLATLVK